jgi:hypothetical protein
MTFQTIEGQKLMNGIVSLDLILFQCRDPLLSWSGFRKVRFSWNETVSERHRSFK